MIYFIQSMCENKFIKIGTASDAACRIAAISTACPYEIRILRIIEGNRKIESGLHVRFRNDRVKSEWFRPSPELLKFIASTKRDDIQDRIGMSKVKNDDYSRLLRRSNGQARRHEVPVKGSMNLEGTT